MLHSIPPVNSDNIIHHNLEKVIIHIAETLDVFHLIIKENTNEFKKIFKTPDICKEVAKDGLIYFSHSQGKHKASRDD
jgi:hypothetical protein